MPAFYRVAVFSAAMGWLPASYCSGQATKPASQTVTAATAPGGSGSPSSWLVRDPQSGRVFQQDVVNVNVPTTQWETRPTTTTVYEPRNVVRVQPSQHTVYTPTTQYVMQPRLRGWWNPLKQPVQGYEFVPVTSWQPQVQTVNRSVAGVEWVPKQQIVYVQQPVQRMVSQQPIVSREIPQAAPSASGGPSQTMLTARPQSPPQMPAAYMARQQSSPWPGFTLGNNLGFSGSSGLRPINPFVSGYHAPLQTASSSTGPLARDPMQAGMAATVLR